MKRIGSQLLILLSAWFATAAFATTQSIDEIQTAAETFVRSHLPASTAKQYVTASKLDPQQMFKTIHDGRPGTLMPSWGKELDADHIWKVITYLRSIRPAGSG